MGQRRLAPSSAGPDGRPSWPALHPAALRLGKRPYLLRNLYGLLLGVVEEDYPCPRSDYFLARFAITHSAIEVAAMLCMNTHCCFALQNVAVERFGSE